MRPRVGRRALLLGLGPLLGLACSAQTTDPKPVSPDAELLEFLGSGDDVDAELQKYLAKQPPSETQDPKPTPKRGSGQT
ncbi:MAG TPA: hypothetical protein VMU00_12395 [Steroidobacteraceae bacterium]|nr:hypothetical protein [Steroidobacteraceae bacterium]